MATGKPGRPKGTPKTGGRQKGGLNKTTVEVREACAQVVDDPTYRAKLIARARAGKLAPAVETMLWHYAKGKPIERVEVSGGLNVSGLSDEELRTRLATLAASV